MTFVLPLCLCDEIRKLRASGRHNSLNINFNTMSMNQQLAVNGGAPAITSPLPPMFPGGLRIGAEEEQAVLDVIRSKRLFRYYGPQAGASIVDQLEEAFARRMGAGHAVAVSSGTGALMCAMAAVGIGPGDEVIVPAYTWIATATAATFLGGIPVVAEIDASLTLDPADVEAKITPRTKAIAAVHMRGGPCRMAELSAIARKHNIALIEDTAQALGASYRGQSLGTIGDVGTFSLQFNKMITAGEGGLVTTNDDMLWQRIVMAHDVVGGARNGIPADEILPGINLRMSELHGAVASVQLTRLDGILRDTRHNRAIVKSGVADVRARKGLTLRDEPDAEGDSGICLVMFMNDAAQAEQAATALRAEGAPASQLYSGNPDYHVYCEWAPIVNHRSWSPAGAPWVWSHGTPRYDKALCPRSLDLLSRAVHLDISPDLSAEQVEELTDALNKVLVAVG